MKRLLGSIVALVVLGFAASPTNAALLTIGHASYVGSIVDAAPANPTVEAGYINYLITLAAGATDIELPPTGGETYNRIGSTLVPTPPGFHAAVDTGAFKDESAPYNPVTLSGTYQYIYGKYGGGALVWYSATGFTGEIEIPNDFNGDLPGGGLSHFSAYKGVAPPGGPNVLPEPTSIAAWLIGLVCCGGAARIRRRAKPAAA